MKCSNCEADIADNSKFCSNCGANIKSSEGEVIEMPSIKPIPKKEDKIKSELKAIFNNVYEKIKSKVKSKVKLKLGEDYEIKEQLKVNRDKLQNKLQKKTAIPNWALVAALGVLVAVILISAIAVTTSNHSPENQEEEQVLIETVSPPFDYDDYTSMDYKEAINKFKNAGFTNIKAEPIDDLIFGIMTSDGEIEKITIDGDEAFDRYETYEAGSEVIITYHTFPISEDTTENASNDTKKSVAEENANNSGLNDKSAESEMSGGEDEVIKDEQLEQLAKNLEKSFPVEKAKRAVVVAMTNSLATDVFNADGNSYDTTKFHAYSDTENYFMSVENEGIWSVMDESYWHIEDMVLKIYGYDTYMKVKANVKKDGENYIVFNVNTIRASSKEYLDSDDESKIAVDTYEPSDSNPFLTVPEALISNDRDAAVEADKLAEKANHEEWINNQFSIWDGKHKKLTELIKDSLNDSKSFKHIETNYIDVSDAQMQTIVNETLKTVGYSERAEIGDLFIMEEFSAKNGFNATIKCMAYGIVRADTDNVILIGIE